MEFGISEHNFESSTPTTIHAMLALNRLTGFRGEKIKFSHSLMLNLCSLIAAILDGGRSLTDTILKVHHLRTIRAMLALMFGSLVSEIFNIFSIGSYVKTMSFDGGHLEFPIGTKT